MEYYVQEVDLNAQGQFISIPESSWLITSKNIATPFGKLKVTKYTIVLKGPLVGVQFSVKGRLNFSSISPRKGRKEIKTLAIMRQPHNVWLWAYAFDKDNNPIINFCGHDVLDGLRNFVDDLEGSSDK